MKYYAGIGSRQTPKEVLNAMTTYAIDLHDLGYTLRSGGAHGADSAFERGAGILKQIFLPWNGFNGRYDELNTYTGTDTPAALEMAARFHPTWNRCSHGAQKLHARNCYQILGPYLDTPVDFVICWTPGGRSGGGTGQALRIALHYEIPIYDLGKAWTAAALEEAIRLEREINTHQQPIVKGTFTSLQFWPGRSVLKQE